MGLASTRQSVTIAVSFGRSSSNTREGSSSRVSGGAAGSRPRIWYSSPDQLASSVSRFHSALPTRLSSEPRRGAGGTARTAGAASGDGTGGGPSRNCAKCSSRSSELMQRQVVQRALPPLLRVRSVVTVRVPAYGVHVALEPPRLRYERVDRAAPWRLGGGAVRREMGRHDALRCGDGTTKADGGTVTTVAQPATPCKGFGNTRYGGASGICHRLHGASCRRTSGGRGRGGPSRRWSTRLEGLSGWSTWCSVACSTVTVF